jgi:D-alanyl-D-alanine carboxypeptidase
VLSSNAGYGYGIGVETIDGRTMLRHTGGATAFASSILVDIDSGVGAFASINAMQGYRPNPVTRYAVDLLYAKKTAKSLPAAPVVDNPMISKNPEEFVGRYKGASGEELKVSVEGKKLMLASSHGRTVLRPLGPDAFSAADGSVLQDEGKTHAHSEFALVFDREKANGDSAGAVKDLTYGSQWYAGEKYQGPHEFVHVEHAERYVGFYALDSPWSSPVRVLERNGKLWMNGTDEMHPSGPDRFSLEGEEGTLEFEFAAFLEGRAQVLRMMGDVLGRVAVGSAL